MSEEKQFKRSETGHSANDLHRLGGSNSVQKDGSEREDLETAIETLNSLDEAENLKNIEQSISSDIEPIESPKSKDGLIDIDVMLEDGISEEEKIPVNIADKSVESEELKGDFNPKDSAKLVEEKKEEPVNTWKASAPIATEPSFTINSVEEPKTQSKKSCVIWKVLAIIFLLIAIAGCGATCFLMFSDGKLEIFGRTIESRDSKKAQPAQVEPKEEEEEEKNPFAGSDLGLDEITAISPLSGLHFSADGKFVAAALANGGYAWKTLAYNNWKTLGGELVPCIELEEDMLTAFSGWNKTTTAEDGTTTQTSVLNCIDTSGTEATISAAEALARHIYTTRDTE